MSKAAGNQFVASHQQEIGKVSGINEGHPLPSAREHDIFNEALDLPPEERAEYLNRACGQDHALRASVEELLRNHFKDATLGNLAEEMRRSFVVSEQIGDTIGHYKLLKEIGEGGCGVVYAAEQQKPLRRLVALKVIKLGMDTRQVIQRFENERQALALLNHKSIARVYDAGATKEGRPYFVMELVHGERITDYADSHGLSIPQRLELFAKVCLAVHHAHENGFIHRDIKPSNILVAEEDGQPLPKVIDFGIAKATADDEGHNKLTVTSQFIGTPAYSSPEQAASCARAIDRRTDIYSLGVLLHGLLIGCLPVSSDGSEQKEPEQPSTKLKKLSEEELSKIVQCRQTDLSALQNTLQGALDRIILKCLEKNPDNRYGTAHNLALDVQGYLGGRPLAGIENQSLKHAELAGGDNRRSKPNKLWQVVCAGVLLLALIGWMVHRPPSPERLPDSPNKAVFLLCEEAVNAPTFEGAQPFLNQIDVTKITDSELTSYALMCKEIADFCAEAGIKRNGATKWSNILNDVDTLKLMGQAIKHPYDTAQKALKIKKEIPEFSNLEEKLKLKYGVN